MSTVKYHHASLRQPLAYSRYNTKTLDCRTARLSELFSNPRHQALNNLRILPLPNFLNHQKASGFRCHENLTVALTSSNGDFNSGSLESLHEPQQVQGEAPSKNFWGAVSLIIGTAVGPGMLGLPAATIRSGPIPSTIAILLSWVYVISSIILVAELSFAAMEEDSVSEVSFTGLATKGLGARAGAFVALVYASLSFALLVACVSGIGSILSQWFPWMNLVITHAIFPFLVGITLLFFHFKVIDAANRFLCGFMLFSISSLVVIGLSVGRMNVLKSFSHASWTLSSVLPAIPVTVLTLGFHVITPFICKIAGNSVAEARKAILIGGVVPLIMVLSWNLIVLGLAGSTSAASANDPIALLLSVNPSALLAVQGFAFSALATSLIGYAVSFPKQVSDTFELILQNPNPKQKYHMEGEDGKVGYVTYSSRHNPANMGKVLFGGPSSTLPSGTAESGFGSQSIIIPLVLGMPVLIASFFRSTFSRALDFAGIYANCFLFGILPPVITYIYQSKRKIRSSSIVPGGRVTLLVLFSISLMLGIWH